IERSLSDVGYKTIPISVTNAMFNYPASNVIQKAPDYFSEMNYKMDYANQLCKDFNAPDALMRIVMGEIIQIRTEKSSEKQSKKKKQSEEKRNEQFEEQEENTVLTSTAYLIRQLKRPEEVALMRKIYGKQFILVSAYGSEEDRLSQLEKKISGTLPVATTK